jgi:hypothetical protein
MISSKVVFMAQGKTGGGFGGAANRHLAALERGRVVVAPIPAQENRPVTPYPGRPGQDGAATKSTPTKDAGVPDSRE